MKTAALLAAALLALQPLLVSAAPPALGIDQAVKLAMDELKGRALDTEHYIGSVTLEDTQLNGGDRYWFVRWFPAVKADDKFETGLRINMDGSIARFVSGGPNGGRPDAPGRRPVGARSIR